MKCCFELFFESLHAIVNLKLKLAKYDNCLFINNCYSYDLIFSISEHPAVRRLISVMILIIFLTTIPISRAIFEGQNSEIIICIGINILILTI